MRIHISIDEPGDGMAQAYATEISEQHALQAFTSAYALSTWMHTRFGNPRVVISTNESEDTITVKSATVKPGAKKPTTYLTISIG